MQTSTYKLSKVINKHGLKAVFLSIAELNGYKIGTVKGKFHFGIKCWLEHKLHNLLVLERVINLPTKELWEELKDYLPKNLRDEWRDSHIEKLKAYKAAETKRAEKHRADQYENIWLERLYLSLDNHFQVQQVIKTKALTQRSALSYIFSKHSASKHEWNVPIELDATALTTSAL